MGSSDGREKYAHSLIEAQARLFTIAVRIPDPAYKASVLENVPENARTLALARAWLGESAPRTNT